MAVDQRVKLKSLYTDDDDNDDGFDNIDFTANFHNNLQQVTCLPLLA